VKLLNFLYIDPFDHHDDTILTTNIVLHMADLHHQNRASVEQVQIQDELHSGSSLISEAKNDSLTQKKPDQSWMLPPSNHSAETSSTESESFKSPGEFFARRSARLEELDKSSSSYFDSTDEESTIPDSFERYMNHQDLYHVLAEESAPLEAMKQSDMEPTAIPSSYKEKQKKEISPTVLDTLDNINPDSVERYHLNQETDCLVLSPMTVGTQKYVYIYVGDSHIESPFTLIHQVS
jgi:hypothetical protein